MAAQAKYFQLVLAAAAKRVSDVYSPSVAGAISPVTDIPYRQVYLQPSGAAAYIGGDSSVTSSVYGNKIDNTNTGSGLMLGPSDQGAIKLSDLYAAGAGATLNILAIPF